MIDPLPIELVHSIVEQKEATEKLVKGIHRKTRKHVGNGMLSPTEFEPQQEMRTEGVQKTRGYSEIPMVRCHTRRKNLKDIERDRFVQDATKMHHGLNAYLTALTPLDDYRAVLRLSDALQQAIRDVTGDEPEWCKVKPGVYPG